MTGTSSSASSSAAAAVVVAGAATVVGASFADGRRPLEVFSLSVAGAATDAPGPGGPGAFDGSFNDAALPRVCTPLGNLNDTLLLASVAVFSDVDMVLRRAVKSSRVDTARSSMWPILRLTGFPSSSWSGRGRYSMAAVGGGGGVHEHLVGPRL
jgi:hypothetical protein